MTSKPSPRRRVAPRPEAVAAESTSDGTQDNPPAPSCGLWPANTFLWEEVLPTMTKDGAVVFGGWWDSARTNAMTAWMESGSIKDFALALAGTPRDRLAYAERRSHARWVSDVLANRRDADAIAEAHRILNLPLPEDRRRRSQQAATLMEQVAELVPDMPEAAYPAWWVFRQRHIVEAVPDGLWPPLGNPAKLRTGRRTPEGKHITFSILPEERKRIDLDARMKAAEGSFG